MADQQQPLQGSVTYNAPYTSLPGGTEYNVGSSPYGNPVNAGGATQPFGGATTGYLYSPFAINPQPGGSAPVYTSGNGLYTAPLHQRQEPTPAYNPLMPSVGTPPPLQGYVNGVYIGPGAAASGGGGVSTGGGGAGGGGGGGGSGGGGGGGGFSSITNNNTVNNFPSIAQLPQVPQGVPFGPTPGSPGYGSPLTPLAQPAMQAANMPMPSGAAGSPISGNGFDFQSGGGSSWGGPTHTPPPGGPASVAGFTPQEATAGLPPPGSPQNPLRGSVEMSAQAQPQQPAAPAPVWANPDYLRGLALSGIETAANFFDALTQPQAAEARGKNQQVPPPPPAPPINGPPPGPGVPVNGLYPPPAPYPPPPGFMPPDKYGNRPDKLGNNPQEQAAGIPNMKAVQAAFDRAKALGAKFDAEAGAVATGLVLNNINSQADLDTKLGEGLEALKRTYEKINNEIFNEPVQRDINQGQHVKAELARINGEIKRKRTLPLTADEVMANSPQSPVITRTGIISGVYNRLMGSDNIPNPAYQIQQGRIAASNARKAAITALANERADLMKQVEYTDKVKASAVAQANLLKANAEKAFWDQMNFKEKMAGNTNSALQSYGTMMIEAGKAQVQRDQFAAQNIATVVQIMAQQSTAAAQIRGLELQLQKAQNDMQRLAAGEARDKAKIEVDYINAITNLVKARTGGNRPVSEEEVMSMSKRILDQLWAERKPSQTAQQGGK